MKELTTEQREWLTNVRPVICGSANGSGDEVTSRRRESPNDSNPCGDIDALEKKYRGIAQKGRRLFPLAAENLDYWLSKKGGTKNIPTRYFTKDSTVRSHLLNVHRSVFLSQEDDSRGIVPRIRRDKVAGKEYSMKWKDSLNGDLNSDLYWGLGGFTLNSYVTVKVLKIQGKTATVGFTSWHSDAEDVYNWDKGKSVFIPWPGLGEIKDEEAICLEKAGRAKSFKMKSPRWIVRDKAITAEAQVYLGDDFDGPETGAGATFIGYVTWVRPGNTMDIVGAKVVLKKDGVPFKEAITTDEPNSQLYGHKGSFQFDDIPPSETRFTYHLSATYKNLATKNGPLDGYVQPKSLKIFTLYVEE